MTPERHPWFKFHASDWRGDTKLRGCSLAARGLWADCLAIMHEATPRGYCSLSTKQLALMVGRPVPEVTRALAELEHHEVSSRNDAGWIYSRRMVRDTAKSLTLAENGKKGAEATNLPRQMLRQMPQQTDQQTPRPAHVTRVLASSVSVPEPKQARTEIPKPQTSLVQARFDTFWDAYPRKTGRKAALKVFQALNPDHEQLGVWLDALAAWRRSTQWRSGIVPHATTWLNGERWADEVPPEPVPVLSGTMTRGERVTALNQGVAERLAARYRSEEIELQSGRALGDGSSAPALAIAGRGEA